MTVRLEHANLVVHDVDEAIRFVQTAFPDFVLRHEGKTWAGARWVHLGIDDSYLALSEAMAQPAEPWVPYSGKPGLNHLGWEVDDLNALESRMKEAGFEPNMKADEHPARQRRYFYDPDGNDWEFVRYLVEDPAQRNDYSQ